MSVITSSNPRISVRIRLAVTITALIAWGGSAYVGCLHASSTSAQPAQVEYHAATSDRDLHNG